MLECFCCFNHLQCRGGLIHLYLARASQCDDHADCKSVLQIGNNSAIPAGFPTGQERFGLDGNSRLQPLHRECGLVCVSPLEAGGCNQGVHTQRVQSANSTVVAGAPIGNWPYGPPVVLWLRAGCTWRSATFSTKNVAAVGGMIQSQTQDLWE